MWSGGADDRFALNMEIEAGIVVMYRRDDIVFWRVFAALVSILEMLVREGLESMPLLRLPSPNLVGMKSRPLRNHQGQRFLWQSTLVVAPAPRGLGMKRMSWSSVGTSLRPDRGMRSLGGNPARVSRNTNESGND